MRILITGSQGFVGRHLLQQFKEDDAELLTPDRSELDILDGQAVSDYMIGHRPDSVIHLAAQSNVGLSWQKPIETAATNILGTLNMYAAFAAQHSSGKFLYVGSSDAYGSVARQDKPLTEDMLCDPQNPYATSKWAAERILLQLSTRDHIKVICTRSFNQYGPGQNRGFVISDFASQLAAIKLGYAEPVVKVGNLSASREFIYVDDVAKTYSYMIRKDIVPGVYNICTGKTVKIESILHKLIHMTGIGVEVQKDASRYRPIDVPIIRGSNERINQFCPIEGTDLDDGLKRTYEYWLERCCIDHEGSNRP